MNLELIEESIKNIIIALGDDPHRQGLVETPKRVAKMYQELFQGMEYTNDQIAEKFDKCFEEAESGKLVIVSHIPIFSCCEHHLALMYNMDVSIGYIPMGKVIGLSKIARIADMVSKRLQLQERIGTDILYIMKKILGTDNIIVLISGEHACMTTRGISKDGAVTKTTAFSGIYEHNPMARQEFYTLL